jgi:hypothetical protein
VALNEVDRRHLARAAIDAGACELLHPSGVPRRESGQPTGDAGEGSPSPCGSRGCGSTGVGRSDPARIRGSGCLCASTAVAADALRLGNGAIATHVGRPGGGERWTRVALF